MLDPKLIETYTGRAYSSVQNGDYDQAISDCTAALRLDSRCAEALAILRNLGFADMVLRCTAW